MQIKIPKKYSKLFKEFMGVAVCTIKSTPDLEKDEKEFIAWLEKQKWTNI